MDRSPNISVSSFRKNHLFLKVFISLILSLFLFVVVLYPDLLKVLPEAASTFLEMLQEFVKRDVVGIV
jgi:hypothetical protein